MKIKRKISRIYVRVKNQGVMANEQNQLNLIELV